MNKGLVFSLNLRAGLASILTQYGRVKPRILCAIVLSFLTVTIAETSFAQEGEVEEVVISAEYIPDEKLATADISEVLDVGDMSITGDSNVGDALKRLPGLSLVGGKFIYIRGLGERYSSTYFNGTPMPGIQPLSRAVPLDLFDTNVIANTLVQKTYSAEYSAEFTGGAVDIRSAVVPDENGFEFSVKTGYNTNSTGEQQLTYSGGGRDWTGYDDGTRALPGIVQRNRGFYPNVVRAGVGNSLSVEDVDNIQYSFSRQNNVWDIDSSGKNPVDIGFSTAIKRRYNPIDSVSFGALATLAYDQKWRNRFERRTRSSDPNNVVSADVRDAALFFGDDDVTSGPLTGQSNVKDSNRLGTIENYNRTLRQVSVNTLLAFGVDIDNTHEIKVTRMLLRDTQDEASELLNRGNDDAARFLNQFFRLQFTENQIGFTQLSGLHVLDFAEINWRYSNVSGSRETPDAREYGRSRNNITNEFELETNQTQAGLYEPSREYSDLVDDSEEYGIDIELPFTSDRRFVTDFKWRIGYSDYSKRREYDSVRFFYRLGDVPLSDEQVAGSLENILDASGCVAGAGTLVNPANDPADNCFLTENGSESPSDGVSVGAGFGPQPSIYDGGINSEAFYSSMDIAVLESLRFNFGVRKERYAIRGSAIDVQPADGGNEPQLIEISSGSQGLYPSFKVTWSFYDNMQLRAAYSETQNRPTLREIVPVRIYNPEDGKQYIGNPDLLISDINSYDLRYEWYFGDKDYVSLSGFKKQIDNPIETQEGEGEGITSTTWENEDSATNEGVELEFRKYLGEYFSFIVNASKISSRLQLNSGARRALQGVSDELYNAQVIYKDRDSSVSLAWNYFSERISTLAALDNNRTRSIFEQPRDSLDFNAKHKFDLGDSELSLGFKVTNILDEKSVEQYESGLIYDEYEIGQTYSLSLGWKQY